MSAERQPLESAIAAIEACRSVMGDAATEAALAPLRQRLADLLPVADQTLRQVSVLFMDIVGSTALSRQLDPEAFHAVVNGTLQACTAIVTAHGGKVLQYAGDNLLAAFGADFTRENEDERAVSAGLALLAEGRRQRAQVQQQHGLDGCDVRVGVHTGPVLLGGGVEGAASIRGITVNVAARMEQTAPPGGLRISAATFGPVRSLFDVEEQPPLPVKGLEQPVVTYLVQRRRAPGAREAPQEAGGLQVALCGREAELAALDVAWAACADGPGICLLTVLGETGLGKTRLALEFERRLRGRAAGLVRLRVQAMPQTETQAYATLRELVAAALGLGDAGAGGAELAPQPFEDAMVPLLKADHGSELAQAHAQLLGHLVGLDYSSSPHVRGILHDARQVRALAFHAATELLRLSAQRAGVPLLLVLDDLHWCDEGTLDFFDHLLGAELAPPLLLLALARPALLERRPTWTASSAQRQQLALQPLDAPASALLARRLLARLPASPPALHQLLTERAQGNPYYMEELLRMLLDEGVLRVAGEGWVLDPERLAAAPLPTSLTGLLQARLDRLGAPERPALLQAAVIGPQFWDRALAAIDEAAPAALPALQARELVQRLPESDDAALHAYAFCHQMLQQVAYDSLLRRQRREWHGRVAAFMESLGPGRYGELVAVAASHYERAGDAPRAGALYERAAHEGSNRLPHGEQLRLAGCALAQLPDAAPLRRWHLECLAYAACMGLNDNAGMGRHLAAMRALAAATGSARVHAETEMLALHTRLESLGLDEAERLMRLAEAAEAAEPAVEADTRGPQALPAPLLPARIEWAWALCQGGQHERAEAVAAELVTLARQHGRPEKQVSAMNTLAVAAWLRGDLSTGLQRMEQVLQHYREQGNRAGELTTLFNLCGFARRLGDFERARELADGGLQLARRVGNRRVGTMLLMRRSQLHEAAGQPQAALADAARMLQQIDAGGGDFARIAGLMAQGKALAALGRNDEAWAAFEHVGKLVRPGSSAAVEALGGVVQVQLARGSTATALSAAEVLLGHLAAPAGIDATEVPGLCLIAHEALLAAGDPRAPALLAQGQRLLREQAARISDAAARQRFLQRPPVNRRLLGDSD